MKADFLGDAAFLYHFSHTNIETTQIYAKITVQKLDNDLTMLGDKLSKSFGNVKMAGI